MGSNINVCDHGCALQADYMDEYMNERFKTGKPLVCPFSDCQMPVLNTSRYVSKTRFQQRKYDFNKESYDMDVLLGIEKGS